MTDKEVNVRNEWGDIEGTAKAEMATTRPWFLHFDISLYPINSSSSPSLSMLLRVFLRVDLAIFSNPDSLVCNFFDYWGSGLASENEKNQFARGVLWTRILGLEDSRAKL